MENKDDVLEKRAEAIKKVETEKEAEKAKLEATKAKVPNKKPTIEVDANTLNDLLATNKRMQDRLDKLDKEEAERNKPYNPYAEKVVENFVTLTLIGEEDEKNLVVGMKPGVKPKSFIDINGRQDTMLLSRFTIMNKEGETMEVEYDSKELTNSRDFLRCKILERKVEKKIKDNGWMSKREFVKSDKDANGVMEKDAGSIRNLETYEEIMYKLELPDGRVVEVPESVVNINQ